MTITTGESPIAFTRRATALLLPAAVTFSISQALTPALAAILARTDDPESSIGGYAVALAIILFVSLPQLRMQQLTLVFLEGRDALPRLRKFVLFWTALVTFIAAILGWTPAGDLVLDGFFSVRGGLRDQADQALALMVPFAGLLVLRAHLNGAALRLDRPGLVWRATAANLLSVFGVGIGLLVSEVVHGAQIAAIAVTVGAAVEIALLVTLTSGPLRRMPSMSEGKPAAYREMARFFAPLLFAAFLPAVTQPIINAGMARAAEPSVSIAAMSVAFGVFQAVTIAANGVQPTILALFARRDDPRRIIRFSLGVGVVVTGISSLIAFIPPLTDLVLGGIMGTEGRLQELSTLALRVLAFLPAVLALEQLYASILMRAKNTRPIVYINLWRLLVLVLWTAGTVQLTDVVGVGVGAGAVSLTLGVEALASYFYGRRSYGAMLREHYAAA